MMKIIKYSSPFSYIARFSKMEKEKMQNTKKMKKPGYLLLQAILAMTAFTMMSYGLVLAFSSSFNMYGASKVALEAQQYAEIEANTLKMLGYDNLATAGHGKSALSYANNWESQVTIGDEQVIDADADNKMRIATVDIFKKGDTTSRYTLNVPLTSQAGTTDNLPVGTILAYTGPINKIPKGWALCNGQNGTPDLRDRFLQGVISDPGQYIAAGLPNITGEFNVGQPPWIGSYGSGCFYGGYGHSGLRYAGGTADPGDLVWRFSASYSNPIYGKSTTVQPKAYTVMYIIKVK